MQEYRAYRGKRHSRKSGRKKDKGGGFSIVLAFILLLAGAAAMGRFLFPEQMRVFTSKINSVCNFKAAFSAIGEGLTSEKDMAQALKEAYMHVFNSDYSESVQVFSESDEETKQTLDEKPLAVFSADDDVLMNSVPVLPVSGKVLCGYGADESGNFNYATTIDADRGSEVKSIFDGTVMAIGDSNTRGNYVVVFHDGVVSEYSCLGEITAQSGQNVAAGDTIAIAGSEPVQLALCCDSGYLDIEGYVTWQHMA